MTKFLNISTDNTLGGSSASDVQVSSQKAVKDYVDGKIPTVNDATITITQGGVTKGSFTLNQASGDTIALDAGGAASDMTGATASTPGTHGLVPAPAAGDQDKVLHGDGTWKVGVGIHPDLFDHKWSDYELSDMNWLRADTFSWQDGGVYEAAYDHLEADISGKSLTSETISGVTVQFYLADDGHKICPASQESNVVSIYNATGIAWYYIIDTVNQRFKLPRTKFGFTGIRSGVGEFVSAGLPNITGSYDYPHLNDTTTSSHLTGAMYIKSVGGDNRRLSSEGGSSPGGLGFDASRSSSVYGNSTTVQPPATQQYLYFYVGNFTQTALENTAGLNTSLFNSKVDLDLNNLNSTGKGKLGVVSIRVADGIVLSSATDPVRGAGRVLVSLYPNGKAKIDFAIKISTSGSSASVFAWGIDPNLLHSLNNNIPVITPGHGTCQYYTSTGSISTAKQGYGGGVFPSSNYWSFGRVYQTDGAFGGWPANQFAADQMIYGTAWGTYSV